MTFSGEGDTPHFFYAQTELSGPVPVIGNETGWVKLIIGEDEAGLPQASVLSGACPVYSAEAPPDHSGKGF